MNMPESIDRQNAGFWDELCGTNFARELGITERSPESIRKFDQAYFEQYPYLAKYIPLKMMKNRRVLEIGTGWGSLGQKIVEAGADYTAMDIAEGPMQMMRYRLDSFSLSGKTVQTNVLKNDLPSGFFDYVISIGCFHHTGNIPKCVEETNRLLKPGGAAVIMLYNQFALHQWLNWPLKTLGAALTGPRPANESQRKDYDMNSSGDGAPFTEFVSARQIRQLFASFRQIRINKDNCREISVWGIRILGRKRALPVIGPLLGQDYYIRVQK